jgi:hypothetical protein
MNREFIRKARRAASAYAKSKSETEGEIEAVFEIAPELERESKLELDSRPELELDLLPSTMRPFDPESDEIEALFQATFGAGARVVAVIGVAPGDGASACAAALAQRSMLGRRSTLLVGASGAAKPPYCRVLNGPAEACGATGSDDPHCCKICVKHGKTAQGVDLAWKRFGGPGGGGDLALLLREPAYLRRRWAENYADWSAMVIDCEATLAEGSAFPGRLVAQSADAVILVALGGATTSESLAAAKAALGSARIVGIVVNGRDQPKVGAEIARRVRRNFRRFPRLSKFLADRAERMRIFDVGV